jgi:3-hydroxyisobutyrate dehydrogenase
MRYGFVRLGNLGKHLATNLARGGFDVGVNDLSRSAARPRFGRRALGGVDTPSRRDLRLLDHLSADPGGSAAVLADALRPAPGSTWIEMSTNDFSEIEAIAARAKRWASLTLACPVTGGVHRAETGEITVLVGGAQQVFALHEAALRAMGGRVIHLGGIEQAAVTKVVTNMLAFIHLIAAGEALMLCAKGGVELRAAYDAIAASSGTSFVHETESQLILNGSYDIGFTMDLHARTPVSP